MAGGRFLPTPVLGPTPPAALIGGVMVGADAVHDVAEPPEPHRRRECPAREKPGDPGGLDGPAGAAPDAEGPPPAGSPQYVPVDAGDELPDEAVGRRHVGVQVLERDRKESRHRTRG